jgi:hypothetical protein
MLNLRLLYSNGDSRGAVAGILALVVFLKNAECLGNGLVESLSADVNRTLDASDVYTNDLAGSERHSGTCSTFVFSSLLNP